MPGETFTIEDSPKSGGSKLLLFGLIGCGTMLVLCCGGIGVVSFMGYQFASNALVEDPDEIRAATSEIAEIDLPDGFAPEALIRLKVPFVGDMGKMVIYEAEDGSGGLFLAEFSEQMTQGKSPEQLAREMQMESALEDQIDPESIDKSGTIPIEREIRGETARFEIVTGKHRETGKEQLVVSGQFKGREGGVGFLMMSVDPQQTSIENVEQMINSIE